MINRLASRIRQAREATSLSQASLARAIGVSDKSVSAYELGRAVPPLAKLKKIASQTNQPLVFFTEDDVDEFVVAGKLAKVERQLADIKRIIRKTRK
ncbi:helix-turn-helix transcriptional regulator [Candidatus Woesebacteria bacterium]|nr:helix-turn-helix transcriptional regulator [Candidatus Woesebacteria bacterium]